MRRLHPLQTPAELQTPAQGSDSGVPLARTWYEKIIEQQSKDPTQPQKEVPNRWITWQRDHRHPLREAIEQRSEGCCAWCGQKGTIQVDHYLPQAIFQKIVYYPPNLLPSCDRCNKAKGTYFPPKLQGVHLIDPVLGPAQLSEQILDFSTLLLGPEERLIHPGEEDPSDHLKFDPATHGYDAPTEAGKCTWKHIFKSGKEKGPVGRLADISTLVQVLLLNPDPDAALEAYKKVHGNHFYVDEYAHFWRSFAPLPSQSPLSQPHGIQPPLI